ncbi:MAG: M1 family aminopeptidase [Bryobacteraceae bacterium]
MQFRSIVARSVCCLCVLQAAGLRTEAARRPAGLPSDTLESLTAAEIASQFDHLALDPNETYHVRDFQLVRGDLKFYLNDGTISFTNPVAGRPVAMVFSALDNEFGDAELLVLPPRRSERLSLASFTNTKSPNLDEHFRAAVFFFTDDTKAEILSQVEKHGSDKTPEVVSQMADQWNPVLRSLAADLDVRLIASLFDGHSASHGLFECVLSGKQLGTFDVVYQPDEPEPIEIGSVDAGSGPPHFRLWASFMPRRPPPLESPPAGLKLANFRIDTTIHADLSQSSVSEAEVSFQHGPVRAIELQISSRMLISGASVDGEPAEVFQHNSVRTESGLMMTPFVIVAKRMLEPGKTHIVNIHYEGNVVQQTETGVYYVADRNAWFPHTGMDLAQFDLTFRCPRSLGVVSTGELIDEHFEGGPEGEQRVVHRKTRVPARFAGFNIGEFESKTVDHGSYRIECFGNRALFAKIRASRAATGNSSSTDIASERLTEMSADIAQIIDEYSREWGPLPLKHIAVSPIPGYFGQGFPGLIYLSTLSYMHQEERPFEARDSQVNTFFSQILLAHEAAHQWWGNVVASAGYRSDWIMESLANYAALEMLERRKGEEAMNQVMALYRRELTSVMKNGQRVDSAGPLELGQRLNEMGGPEAWRIITYEKGSWVMHMLRHRMGREAFEEMMRRLVRDYAGKPLSNEDFQKMASEYVPAGQPDRSLDLFFDTWVYGTGIPTLRLKAPGTGHKDYTLTQTGVPDDFTVDVPLVQTGSQGKRQLKWVRSTGEDVPIEAPATKSAALQLPRLEDFLYVQ